MVNKRRTSHNLQKWNRISNLVYATIKRLSLLYKALLWRNTIYERPASTFRVRQSEVSAQLQQLDGFLHLSLLGKELRDWSLKISNSLLCGEIQGIPLWTRQTKVYMCWGKPSVRRLSAAKQNIGYPDLGVENELSFLWNCSWRIHLNTSNTTLQNLRRS